MGWQFDRSRGRSKRCGAEIAHAAKNISFEDLSAGVSPSSDTRNVKEVLDEVIEQVSTPTVANLTSTTATGIYSSTTGGVSYLRPLSSGRSVVITNSSPSITIDSFGGLFNSDDPWIDGAPNGIPQYSISGTWKTGHLSRSPNDPYYAVNLKVHSLTGDRLSRQPRTFGVSVITREMHRAAWGVVQRTAC